jgi:hypothetical protein
MHFDGIIVGVATFIIIGIFHPLVIWGEYYLGTSIWPLFLCLGILALSVSLFAGPALIRSILGITGFSLLWSIIEIFHQRERVKKGWYPENPRRKRA